MKSNLFSIHLEAIDLLKGNLNSKIDFRTGFHKKICAAQQAINNLIVLWNAMNVKLRTIFSVDELDWWNRLPSHMDGMASWSRPRSGGSNVICALDPTNILPSLCTYHADNYGRIRSVKNEIQIYAYNYTSSPSDKWIRPPDRMLQGRWLRLMWTCAEDALRGNLFCWAKMW